MTAIQAELLETTREPQGGYRYWRDIAVDLAKLPADMLLQKLEQSDPFETRAFEIKLLVAEKRKGSLLNSSELRGLYECPPKRLRMTVPDARNHTSLTAFRKRNEATKDFSFLFFQHLRKTGGTTFCKLAENNLPVGTVPPYYCMPDMHWSDANQCAGCLGHWNNTEIITKMQSQGHLIASNEWDGFDSNRFFELPAVFATIFRRPLDRAVSQFRFDCIDNQGCKGMRNITEWWGEMTGLQNVFTRTFTNRNGIEEAYHSSHPNHGEKRASLVGQALDTLSQFHLIMVMEWMGYSTTQVESVLGFSNTALLAHRIRPYVGSFARNDGQEVNRLGASGIGLASWNPKNYLSDQQFQRMSEDLALDMILNEAARRMFLERMVCDGED
jgi:hypothetical protein